MTTNHSSTTRTVAIVSAVIGGVVLLAVGGAALLAVTQSLFRPESSAHQTLSVPTDGVTQLSVDSHSAHVTVQFDDVPEAVLDVSGERASDWRLTNRHGELKVDKDTWWLGGFCFIACWGDRTDVTLTLPEDLNDGRMDAGFDIASGEVSATGRFDALEIDLASGSIDFDGSARTFNGGVASGDARLAVDSPDEFRVDVASGNVEAAVTGSTPRSVEVDIASGDVQLTLPDAEYRYSQDIASGNVRNDLRTSPTAKASVDVKVASGNVTLR